MEQNSDISQQKPSTSGGRPRPKLARDLDPVGHKDVSNRRKCPDCDGRISKENKSKSRVWKKVMWFTRRNKTSKSDVCQCQTDEGFSNIEDRHSNSWSFTRSASRKFRSSSRKRQCKSESSKHSVRGKRDEACTSRESSLPSVSAGSVSSSGANSPTATGSFCDFGATSHAGKRGSKGHKNTFVLTEIARAINPPVKNDVLPLSDINSPPKQLSKSSSSVSHIYRRSQSPITGNVRRSKSFPGSQSSISPSKRRFINTANKTFASFSPPLKQKCYGLRRTATFSGKLNMEFPKVCLKKSKSANAAEFTKLDRAASLGEIRDQSGSIVGIVHFYKSPKKLATRRMSSFNHEVKNDCMLEEDEFLCNGDQRSSISNILQTSPSSESETVDVDPIVRCMEPDTRLFLNNSTHDMNCGANIACASGIPGKLAESQGCCVSVNKTFKDTSKIIEEFSSIEDESLCFTLPSKLDESMNISKFETVSETVELSCVHDDQMVDCLSHKDDYLLMEPPSTSITCHQSSHDGKFHDQMSDDYDNNYLLTESVTTSYNGDVNFDTEPEFEVRSVDDTPFYEGLEDCSNDARCLDNEIEITEQFESLTASDDRNLQSPKKAKPIHSATVTNSDLTSLEVFDTPSGCINLVSKPETDLALELFDISSSSAKSECEQGDLYEEGQNDLCFSPQKSESLTKIATPVQRCVHSSPEMLECSRTSGYVSIIEESQQHVPIHTWKTSESSEMKSDDIGLPVPGQTFKMRTELMLSWFEEFNDEQRNIILKKILNRCELPQMHLLSVAMENNLHKTCPPNCQDMLVWLPYTVTLKILMYLDAASLCRCNQVNRAWNELADNPLLWQGLTRNPDYQLSEASSKRQYQKFTQANGEIRWKKVFAERYLLQRNWLNGKYKLRTFEGHNQGIACVQFDDTRIVSGSSDKTIKLWDISNTPSELMLTLEGHSGTVRCLDLNGNRLVSGSTDRTIKVWDLSFASYWAGASCKVTMVGHLHTVRCLQADEKKLVSGSYDKTVKVWDLKTGECQLTLRGHTAAVLCVQFDDQKIVSGSYDKKIKVWDLTEGTCLMTLDGHQDAVTCLNLTHDGMKIITGSLDYSLKFWDLSTGKCYGTLDWITSEGHTAVVRCLQVDSWRIVSGGDDKTLKVWELATGQRLLTLRYHSDGVTCMQFNDFAIVSGSYDRTVKLWDFTPKHPYLEAVT